MDVKKVYLAGPITGSNWNESEDWCDALKRRARKITIVDTDGGMKVKVAYPFEHVKFYSPLRGKDYLKNVDTIKDSYDEHKFSTGKSIMLRDHYDVQTADAVIVNLIGATRVSIGTVMEIAWAYAYRKPVICIIEEPEKQEIGFAASSGNIHEHAMLNEAIWWRAKNIDEALDALNRLFNE